MNNQTLRTADERLAPTNKFPQKVMILESGIKLSYDEMDFTEGGLNSDHVCLYEKGLLFAVIDLRRVSGITLGVNNSAPR